MSDTTNVFEKITSEYYHFTASEKKIADYVLSHKNQVQYMSISDLSDEIDVSEATISRFCKGMGMRSYNAFKLMLAEATAKASTDHAVADESEMESVVRELTGSYTHALKQSAEFLRPEVVKEAVGALMNARIVLCMGQGGSMIPATTSAHLMSTISTKFFAVQGSHNQILKTALLGSEDVILFFSYSGSTVEIVDLMNLAKKRGVKIILITRFLKSPGAKLADIVLQCGSDEGPLQLSSMPALVAELFLVDILYNEYCRALPEETLESKEIAATAMAERHI